MSAWTGALVVEAAAAVVLVVSLRRAFFGRAPQRPDRVAAAGWILAGLLLLATAVVSTDTTILRLVLNACAVEALCVGCWWLRSRRDDDGGEPAGDPPPDWDEFDRLRDRWSAGPPRDRLPVA